MKYILLVDYLLKNRLLNKLYLTSLLLINLFMPVR